MTPGFTATISWDAERSNEAEAGTWGELTIALDGVPLWGAREGSTARGARWTWVDLLEHLAEVWPWLLGEEGWPSQASPTARNATTEDDEVFEHRYRHDLAMAIRGKVLPPLWIVREGAHVSVCGETIRARLELRAVEAVLQSLGDQIAERLSGIDQERAREAVHAWVSREQPPAPQHPCDTSAPATACS
jgi:hypothetical protein